MKSGKYDYHAAENQFERFRWVLELCSRFEFDFVVAKLFLKDSIFWCVQSSVTCNETVHVYVLWLVCLHPRNPYSKVVVSVTTHDDMYKYAKQKRDVAKNVKPLRKVKGFLKRTSWKVSDVQIVRETWVLVAKDKSNHQVADSLLRELELNNFIR